MRRFAHLLALLALALQTLVAAPHIHAVPGQPLTVAVAAQAQQESAQLKADHHHARAACVICQALAATGHALAPSAAAWVEPLTLAQLAGADGATHARGFAGYDWLSRGPPTSL